MKKILVITYYWPPHAGVGVQRWLKFVKYLPSYGWDPIVFTPENAAFDLEDPNLLKEIPESVEVLRFPIWEPFSIFNKLTRGKNKKNIKQGLVLEKSNKSWLDKLIVFLRGNIFIPDPRRFWVRPSVRFLTEFVVLHQIDTIITTGPPHSVHLIGLGLKSGLNIKWIADFRDPWSKWDLLDKLNATRLARKVHRKYELSVLRNADKVLTVSEYLADDLQRLGANAVQVITNGVDIDQIKVDFSQAKDIQKFRISHIGLLNEMRDPDILWEVLRELIDEVPEFGDDLEINLAGIVSESILKKLKSTSLKEVLQYKSYISHDQVFKELQQSALLLVVLNNTNNARWIIPGKMFEYLIAKRRILLLGPEMSNAADILITSEAGCVVDFHERKKLKEEILNAYHAFKSGNVVLENINVEAYSRKKLTGDLSQILNEI